MIETPADENNPEIGQGFDEAADGGEAAAKEQRRADRERKQDERRRNLAAVFGHGPGKLALVALLVFVVVGAAMGIRALTRDPEADAQAAADAKVDSPRAPEPTVTVEPISPEEAQRRAEVASREAEEAAAAGESYQPSFDPLIAGNGPADTGPAAFETTEAPPVDNPAGAGTTLRFRDRNAPQGPGTQGMPATAAATAAAPAAYPTHTVNPNQAAPAGQGGAPAEDEATRRQREQQLMQQYQQAVQARDTHVQQLRDAAMKQIEDYVGMSEGQSPLNGYGVASAAAYGTSDQQRTAGGGVAGSGLSPDPAAGGYNNPTNEPPLIKAGSTAYATLDSEMNTDDSPDVFATIRGGDWDGAKIIGTVQQGPRQAAINFTVLAPQDSRPTMSINAVALREEDLKRGMADDIDHHTFSRYTALAVSALMSGYGRAAAIVPGTSIVTPGGATIVTTQKPTDEEIRGAAIGEVGVQMSQEVRRGFNRPATYSTPAQRGFVLYFTRDVTSAQAPAQAPAQAQTPTSPPSYTMPAAEPTVPDTSAVNSTLPMTNNAQGGFQ